MNNVRRKALREIIDRLSVIRSDLEMLADEEREYMENMPENLWGSERYEKAEEAVDNLDEALGSLEEIEEAIENACE